MDIESLSAMREAALDYFVRSRATQRRRALMEQPDAGEAEGWSAMAELGWAGMLAPESVGGLGLELDGAAEILRAAGEHAAPEPLLAVAGLSALLLARLDSPGARALLADLIAGRSLPALAWQESAGDLSAVPLACGCEERRGGVLLQGEKLMVLPGAAASGWLVSARGEDDAVILWVPRGAEGVTETRMPLVDGGQASSLRFEQVALPPDAVLAEGAAAQEALRHALAAGQILQAAELLGAGQAMLAQTLAYLRTRSQFGKPIGSFQALQHRCVDMFIHLEVAQATLNEVLALAGAGLPVERLEAEASRVNARCTAAALQASRTSVQLHGAIGYTQECDLSLFYKRVLCLSAWLGNVTAHQHRHAALTNEGEATANTAAWTGEFPRTADWSAMPEDEFRRMVRGFLQQRYPQELRYLSHRARWSEVREWYLTLSAQGWIAPAWPQAHGGMGLPADKLIAWIEELEQYGVARAPDQGIVMIGPLLIQHGTPEQQQRFLPRILRGEHVWCQGYSEPNAGSDLAGLRTEAVAGRDAEGDGESDHFIVNGQKIWTTLAQDANHIFMLVRTDKAARKQEGISFLLCDLRTPGITVRPIHTLAGEPEFCEVFFDNVRVPAENLVGKLHGGWTIAKALLGFERIFLGSPKQSQYALGQLARLAEARRLFADPVFAQRFAALRLDVADLTAAYTSFADIVRAGKPLPASVSLLKIWASETYHRIGALLVEAGEEQGAVAGDQVLDGQTFNVLSPLIGSTAAMIYGGTNEIQRNILARQVLELPA
ncbi:alkylation response protein AidB-like acyl-CoA dehydrogenase [Variovorax boronicumulans]|uniref:acyl-CoA dehydrogenase n=1 Tax=Variovorax boronicumulans TaxID=436515 RepID=UPI002783E801|nr:acyl-CoA dehydrogenase [Variovorax boronicumulans]MDP9996067.1 alkylation response protein AidB-like acyl-CoA dehydrogenase [Variovorax boronicumulans]MDQ0002614.1 alkylation response protein AidB-like acyl-CoA dehydrogenase [Variovorax boronicumulans]